MAAASSRRAGRICTTLLAGVVGDERRHGLDLRVRELALEGGHDPAAVLDLVLGDALGRLQLVQVRADRAVRARGLQRVAARALGREDLLAVGAEVGRVAAAGPAPAAGGGDVRGHVLGVLALDEVRRHRRRGLPDLEQHDVLDGALLEALLVVVLEGVVEVRPDRPLRARGRERVAAAALRLEQLGAVRLVARAGRRAARPATCEQQRQTDEQERLPQRWVLYAGGLLPVVPSFATASSRVG